MYSFAIQRGAGVLCSWDLSAGGVTFHSRAVQQNGMLVVDESDKLSLVVNEPPGDHDYRVTIGDISLADMVSNPEDVGGVALGDRIIWRELAYFESARGLTKVLLERQPRDAIPEKWEPIISVDVCVMPSKLGEDRYESMAGEMQAVSRSLLVDLYGKSRQTHDVRLSKEGSTVRSHDHALYSIETVLDQLEPLLRSIGQRPACRVKSTSVRRNYWGETRLAPAAVSWLVRRGESPRRPNRPLVVVVPKKTESFDIPEHRVVKAFLAIVVRRAHSCLQVAKDHISDIQSERHLRHIRLSTGPTIFESVDLPRIKRLEQAVTRARQCIRLAAGLGELHFLREVRPQLVAAASHEGLFQRNAEYQVLLQVIRQFLLSNALWYEGDERAEVTKLTSRLFEQWCYLRIVEGFRASGLELREWSDALRQNLNSRFTLDFDRGLTFEGELGDGLRLRFRYEPWILSRESAATAGETLCRGSSSNVAWCPDVVIECLREQDGTWRPVYSVVLDCKYTGLVKRQHWSGTEKYLEIRSTHTQRQVVRQLWLVAPAEQVSIQCEDPAVTFAVDGPTCAPDEAVRFRLLVVPGDDGGKGLFEQFAAGTIAYLRRHFGSSMAD